MRPTWTLCCAVRACVRVCGLIARWEFTSNVGRCYVIRCFVFSMVSFVFVVVSFVFVVVSFVFFMVFFVFFVVVFVFVVVFFVLFVISFVFSVVSLGLRKLWPNIGPD